MYKHAVEVLRKSILPFVFGVQGLDIPYPAKLISKDENASESGSVVFRLDERGLLIAEYFAYDVQIGDIWAVPENQSDVTRFVHLVDTGREIPIQFVNSSNKTRRIYTQVKMPSVKAFECSISGWIGDPCAEMTLVNASLDGCAILKLFRSGEKNIWGVGEGENRLPTTAYYDSRITQVIELTAGGWEVRIRSSSEDNRDSLSEEPPYSISIRKCDDSKFESTEKSEFLQLMQVLRLLFSFSSERWVEYSTIYGGIPKAWPHVANRAYIGRFASRGWSQKRKVDISELGEWPVLFQGLWNSRESPQMISALTHLISCGDRSKDGVFSYQDLVDAYGALEAAVRLWNDLDPTYRFYGNDGSNALLVHLRKVVSEFRMNDKTLDSDEVLSVVPRASKNRATLAHGSGGEIYRSGSSETGQVVAHHQYLYNLARLLVLAKLGGSTGHPGIRWYAPKLVPA